MKKNKIILLLIVTTLLLSACSEKKQYEEAVLTEMQTEPDIKDYKLDPVIMADCVVETTSRKMPGIFTGDPERLKAYVAYTKLVTLKKAKDPQQVMNELRKDFGSAQGLLDARNNYAESLVECQTGMITNSEEETPDRDAPAISTPEKAATPVPTTTPNPVK